MKLVVKVGGAALERPEARRDFAAAIAAARSDGHDVVLVHGGGNQVGALTSRLGLETRRVAGLRVTDPETAEAVLQVLGGEVSRKLVAALGSEGVAALSLTGADASLFTADRLEHEGADLGLVGEVQSVDASVLERLVAAGFVPTVATVAPDPTTDHFLNVNADHAVAPIASAWGADAVLFLSDVPGVLDAERARIESLTPTLAAELERTEVVAGGMIPKVDAALAAASANPDAIVKIAPANGEHARDAVRAALLPETGTRFHAEVTRA